MWDSLALGGIPFHLDGDHGLIVEGLDACGMFRRRLEDRFHHGLRRIRPTFGDDFFQTGAAKEFACFVRRIENAVTEEHKDVIGFRLESEFVAEDGALMLQR